MAAFLVEGEIRNEIQGKNTTLRVVFLYIKI